MSNLYMGIDVGKKYCWTCVLNEEYECVYFDHLETLNEQAWRDMLGLFEGYEVHAAFEIGAHYEWMFDLLSEYCVLGASRRRMNCPVTLAYAGRWTSREAC